MALSHDLDEPLVLQVTDRLRASDAFTLSRSETVAGVMSFAFGISFVSLSTVALSHMTLFINFSFTFPLDHFFLPFLPPAAAAAAFCSFDFCAFGAIAAWTLEP